MNINISMVYVEKTWHEIKINSERVLNKYIWQKCVQLGVDRTNEEKKKQQNMENGI